MKFHFSSSRGETKNNFSSRISRDRDSCQGLIAMLKAIDFFQNSLTEHQWLNFYFKCKYVSVSIIYDLTVPLQF